jgi:serine/threonine protein kinase
MAAAASNISRRQRRSLADIVGKIVESGKGCLNASNDNNLNQENNNGRRRRYVYKYLVGYRLIDSSSLTMTQLKTVCKLLTVLNPGLAEYEIGQVMKRYLTENGQPNAFHEYFSFPISRKIVDSQNQVSTVCQERLAKNIDYFTKKLHAIDHIQFQPISIQLKMRYINGQDLFNYMGTLLSGTQSILSDVKMLLQGILLLHRAGVLHNDIKPENVMVETNPDNSPKSFKWIDFDTSLLANEIGNRLEHIPISTPVYMAPELHRTHVRTIPTSKRDYTTRDPGLNSYLSRTFLDQPFFIIMLSYYWGIPQNITDIIDYVYNQYRQSTSLSTYTCDIYSTGLMIGSYLYEKYKPDHIPEQLRQLIGQMTSPNFTSRPSLENVHQQIDAFITAAATNNMPSKRKHR